MSFEHYKNRSTYYLSCYLLRLLQFEHRREIILHTRHLDPPRSMQQGNPFQSAFPFTGNETMNLPDFFDLAEGLTSTYVVQELSFNELPALLPCDNH